MTRLSILLTCLSLLWCEGWRLGVARLQLKKPLQYVAGACIALSCGTTLGALPSSAAATAATGTTATSSGLSSSMSTPSASALASASKYKLFEEVWGIVNANFVDDTYNGNSWQQVKGEYLSRLERGADEHAVLKKMLSLLGDKYTRLLDKAFFESLWKYDAIGVGLLFESEPQRPLFIAGPPISKSSGEAAGLRKGDVIFSINGKSTQGMTAMSVLDMMSNDESDSVTLEYGREQPTAAVAAGEGQGAPAPAPSLERKTVVLKRSKQKAENPISYSSQRLPDGTLAGYVRFSDFNSESVPGLRAALAALDAEKVDEILLDLRGNTGGGFQFALNVGGMFMDGKDMATAIGKGGEKSVFRTSYPDGVVYTKPLLVLMDGLSASASEVLTGGLHDNCRAVTVGATSFGKGKIQAVFGLSNGEGLVMTVAQYVTPRGTVIQSRGLAPDIAIPQVNPYLGLAIGGLGKPDLANIDFAAAKELLKQCVPPTPSNK